MRRGCVTTGAAALAALLAIPAPAAAQGRPDLSRLTCTEAQGILEQRGAATFSTGAFTYDRFVANPRECGRNSGTVARGVATADNPRCPLRQCVGRRSDDGNR